MAEEAKNDSGEQTSKPKTPSKPKGNGKSKKKKARKQAADELLAQAEGAGTVIATLSQSGTGQTKLDCIREQIRDWREAAEEASDRECEDKELEAATKRGVELAIQAGRDSGWSGATLNKAIRLNQGEEDNG